MNDGVEGDDNGSLLKGLMDRATSPEDLMSGLKWLDGGPLSDSCIDLDAGDLTWIQAIGCEKWGFDLEFLLGTQDQHFRSTTKLPLALTHEVLCLYLAEDLRWKQKFQYQWFDVKPRQRELEKMLRGPIRRFFSAISDAAALLRSVASTRTELTGSQPSVLPHPRWPSLVSQRCLDL